MDWDHIATLLEQAQAGDKKAFNELTSMTHSYVWKYLHWLVRRRDVADDLTQEVFLTLTRQYWRIDNPYGLRNWFRTVGFRKLRKWVAGKKRQAVPIDTYYLRERMWTWAWGGEPANPHEVLANQEAEERLKRGFREAVEQLPARLRECFKEVELKKRPKEEVAREKGLQVGTVQSYCARAKAALLEDNRLREDMEDWYGKMS